MLQYENIDVPEEMKQVCLKEVCFSIIGILKVLDLSLNHMFVTNVTMY